MSTLLRPEEVEKIRDWAATEYKAAHRLQGHVWDGKIPVAHLIRQLRIVITQREAKKETAKVSKLSKEEIDRRIDSLEAELQGAEVDENGVNLDNVLRYGLFFYTLCFHPDGGSVGGACRTSLFLSAKWLI